MNDTGLRLADIETSVKNQEVWRVVVRCLDFPPPPKDDDDDDQHTFYRDSFGCQIVAMLKNKLLPMPPGGVA